MTLKRNLFYLFTVTLLALGVWLSLLFHTDPTYADILTWLTFLGALFLWLSGFLTFILFYLKLTFVNHETVYNLLPGCVRQSAEIGLAVVGLLALQALRVLGWWEGGLYVLVILLIELFFQTQPLAKKGVSKKLIRSRDRVV